MIPKERIEQIAACFREGKSYRQTMVETGISKGTVAKHAVRAMTLCLMARSRFDQIPAFALCADRRLSDDTFRDDNATKFHFLGYNCLAMLAGDWNMAKEMGIWLERSLKTYDSPPERADLKPRLERALTSFCLSSLCADEGACEALVTAFPDETPMCFRLTVCHRQGSVHIAPDSDGIGEGVQAADMLLKYRNYDPLNTPLTMTCYLLYEAKRFSEVYLSISQSSTQVKIHTPTGAAPTKLELSLYDCPVRNVEKLETHRLKCFPNAAEGIQEFPLHYFTKADIETLRRIEGLPFPRRTKADP